MIASVLLLLLNFAHAYHEGEVRVGTYYETNTFYEADDKEADIAFLVEPNIYYTSVSESRYTFETNSSAAFTKYLSNTNQDNLTYDLNLKNSLRIGEKSKIYITPKTRLISEPALEKTEDRLERQFVGAEMGLALVKDSRRQYIFEAGYEQESMSQSAYDHLNNQTISSHLYYKKYFLPETFVYFGVSGNMRSFPDGKTAPNSRFKYDSQRIEPGMGIEGRLTRYFKIRSYLGYALLQYEEEVNYNDPVYLLELEEEMSPRDFLLMGLENTVEDSYFTNFQINQKVYVGYGRFFGDQILWVTKAEYLYKTFSRPQRRDDQRFIADTRMEYSFSQKIKLEASLMLDVLSSDAVNPDATPIDPSASYQNIRFGFFAKYLF